MHLAALALNITLRTAKLNKSITMPLIISVKRQDMALRKMKCQHSKSAMRQVVSGWIILTMGQLKYACKICRVIKRVS